MGKKPFVNKKTAATFALVFRDSSDDASGSQVGDKVFTRVDGGSNYVQGFTEDDPWSQVAHNGMAARGSQPGRRAIDEEEWGEWDEGASVGIEGDGCFDDAEEDNEGASRLPLRGANDPAAGGSSSLHQGALAGSMGSRSQLPPQVREEIIALGFPDDGYNYLTHMRQIGGPQGGGSFIPATWTKPAIRPDVKAFDARSVSAAVVVGIKNADASVDRAPPEELSRGVHQIRSQGPAQRLPGIDPDIAKALYDSDGSGDEEEELEDEFVMMALQECASSTGPGEEMNDPGPEVGIKGNGGSSSVGLDRNCTEVGGVQEGGPEGGSKRNKPTSIVDEEEEEEGSAWGSEREEDGEGQTRSQPSGRCAPAEARPLRPLDEEFQNLALEYDEEGDWNDDDDEDPEARGTADIAEYSEVLDEFLSKHDTGTNPFVYAPPPDARSLVARVAPHFVRTSKVEDGGEREGEAGEEEEELPEMVEYVIKEVKQEECWDMETIVSTYSNLDNHPARIGAPSSRRSRQPVKAELPPVTNVIRLSGRQNLPVDYLPPRTAGGGAGSASHSMPPSGEVPVREHVTAKKGGPRGGETPAERKARKAMVKEERRDARVAKKASKVLYRGEAKRAQIGAAQTCVQGIHLP